MTPLGLPGRYDLLQSIGSGGGGQVFAVCDRYLQRKLALKLFTPGAAEGVTEEDFFREFLLTLMLSHKHLVKAYDYGYAEGNFPFYTMDLLPPESIAESLVGQSCEVVLEVCRQIASALAFLHFHNLVHGDIKQENIKLVFCEEKPVVKLLDFGLTRDFHRQSDLPRRSGTVEYMAPEILRAEAADWRSDLYSLGVIFFELITGHLPFENADPLRIISDKLERPVPSLEQWLGKYPREFLDLTASLLATNPGQRPGSAREVAAQLASLTGTLTHDMNFTDIIRSGLSLQLSRRLEKEIPWRFDPQPMLFEDQFVLEQYALLLKAFLQKEYYNIGFGRDGQVDDLSLSATIAAGKQAIIEIQHLKPDQPPIFSPEADRFPSCRLLVKTRYCRQPEEPAWRRFDFDLSSELERWFVDESAGQELLGKLREISSGGLEILAQILNAMLSRGIIAFGDRECEVDEERFAVFPTPEEVQNQALQWVNHLPPEDFRDLCRIAIIRHPFSSSFISEFLRDCRSNPMAFIEELTQYGILTREGDDYRLQNSALRIGLVQKNDEQERKQLHYRAASIIESSGTLNRPGNILNIADHYTLAEKPVESARWSLLAADQLLSQNKYLLAQRIISRSLELVERHWTVREQANLHAMLLAARGDIENRLGLTQKSLRTFSRIVRRKRAILDQSLIARAYKNLGDLYKSRGDYRRGLKALKEALEIYISLDDQVEISHTYNNIGNIHWVGSEIDQALEAYQKALQIQERLSLLKDVASTLNNIGTCHIMKCQYEKAIEYYKRSIEIKKSINDLVELARTYNNLGATYHEMGALDEALIYLQDSLKINREIGLTGEVLLNLENIAACELTLGQYQNARANIREGLMIAHKIANLPSQASFALMRGNLYYLTGYYGKAERALGKALGLIGQISDLSLHFSACLALVRLYLTLNQPDLFQEYLACAQALAQKGDNLRWRVQSLICESRGWLKFRKDHTRAVAILDDALCLGRGCQSDSLTCLLLLNELSLKGDKNYPREKLTELARLVKLPVNRIYYPELRYYCARLSLAQGNPRRARQESLEAASMAEKYDQKHLLWKARFMQGMAEKSLLNYEEAYFDFRQAVATLRELASRIGKKEYVKDFLQHPLALALKLEIADLSARMEKK